jgi:hypothetical protein
MPFFRIIPLSKINHSQNFRSRLRYWIASAIWAGPMFSSPAKSAMVRATLRIRSCARALKPRVSKACFISWSDAGSNLQYLRISAVLMVLLVFVSLPRKRSCCLFRAWFTRFRMEAEDSPLSPSLNVLKSTLGTSMWMSIRSSKGPEILDRYRCTWCGVQVQLRSSSYPKKPHGQACSEQLGNGHPPRNETQCHPK